MGLPSHKVRPAKQKSARVYTRYRPEKTLLYQIIDDFELRGKGTKSNYDKACLEFTKRHVTHTWPLPEAMKKLIVERNVAIHGIMVASVSELNVPGNLKTVDLTLRLSELDVPVLMTCGSDDLCTPAFTKWQAEFASNAQFHIIEGSAHMTPVDQPSELLKLQRAFLREDAMHDIVKSDVTRK